MPYNLLGTRGGLIAQSGFPGYQNGKQKENTIIAKNGHTIFCSVQGSKPWQVVQRSIRLTAAPTVP